MPNVGTRSPRLLRAVRLVEHRRRTLEQQGPIREAGQKFKSSLSTPARFTFAHLILG